ncbi:MAG: hypothetical protein GY758_27920, partial [Fuerstiella sp.]|nr:hypothetical protein [Fuerstiella sp.]
MSIAYLLIFATTSPMSSEQALEVATSAVEPVISAISQLEDTSPPESTSSVNPGAADTDAKAEVTVVIDTREVTSATDSITPEVVEAEVVEAEVVEAEVVEAEVVEAEVVEAEMVEAE